MKIAHEALQGHAIWNGTTLVISHMGLVNYCFIPAISHKVSYCVVPGEGADKDFYVISDRYGGCEFHTLYNPTHNMFAFLHVYRSSGVTINYKLRPGWVLQSVKRSAEISQAYGMAGSNWSVTHINRATRPASAQSCFIHLNSMLNVMGVSDGNVPYRQEDCCTIL